MDLFHSDVISLPVLDIIVLLIYARTQVAQFVIGNLAARRNLSSFEIRLQLTNTVVRTLLVIDDGRT